MKRYKLLMSIMAFLLVALFVHQKTAVVQAAEPTVIKISAIGLEDAAKMVKNFTPLCKYLSEKTGAKVIFVPKPNYTAVVEALGNKSIDIASLGPVTYVQARNKYGVEPIVKAEENGHSIYSSIIFTRSDSPLSTLRDLKGKKVAFGDTESTSSNCAPKYLLKQNNINVSDLAQTKNFTSQDEVISVVISKEYDAGAIKESVFIRNQSKGLKILGKFSTIPTFPYVARKGFDPNLKLKVKKALLDLKDPAILQSIEKTYTGFNEVKDSEYGWIQPAMIIIGIPTK